MNILISYLTTFQKNICRIKTIIQMNETMSREKTKNSTDGQRTVHQLDALATVEEGCGSKQGDQEEQEKSWWS